ncbi:MAG: DUF692 family multinuclear iron-containing protein [Gallionellaceae bacterium]
MLIGVNLTSPKGLPVIQKLLSHGVVDFCEILIDNFLHVSPESIQEALGGAPIAFHIMWSRFLEKKPEELKLIGKYLRKWIQELHPLYVSDHLAQFTNNGRRLPLLAELNYQTAYAHTKARICDWQEILEHSIAFENFPSTLDYEAKQVEFYDRLLADTGCEILFDVSNALVGERNCGVSPLLWMPLVNNVSWFHAGGFRMSDTTPSLAIDTHDAPLADATLEFIKHVMKRRENSIKGTLVIERDANIEYASWKDEILMVRNFYAKHPNLFVA